MHEHFLQSNTWAKFQKAVGNTVIKHTTEAWSYLAIVEKDRFGTYVYAPYGPYAVDETTLGQATKHLVAAAKRVGAYMVYIEPFLPVTREMAQTVLPPIGAKMSTYRQPSTTQIINLEQPLDDIISQMSATQRNLYRNHEKKGLKIRQSTSENDMSIFMTLLKQNASVKSFYIRKEKFFSTMAHTLLKAGDAKLYIGWYEETTPVIASLVYDSIDTRYYAFVGRDYSFDKLRANGPLVSRLIVDAKKAGKKSFDLYGIADSDDPKHPLYSFTAFKKTFGGESVQLAGTWEIPLNNKKYYTKKTLQHLKKLAKR